MAIVRMLAQWILPGADDPTQRRLQRALLWSWVPLASLSALAGYALHAHLERPFLLWTPEQLSALLGVVLSWPVAVGSLGLLLLLRHREALNGLIGRFKALGPAEFHPQPQPIDPLASVPAPAADDGGLERPPSAVDGTPAQRASTDWEAEARRWRFRFLDLFLVPRTKAALNHAVERMPFEQFLDDLSRAIPDSIQVSATMHALHGQGLIKIDSHVEATPLGKEYLASLGTDRENVFPNLADFAARVAETAGGRPEFRAPMPWRTKAPTPHPPPIKTPPEEGA